MHFAKFNHQDTPLIRAKYSIQKHFFTYDTTHSHHSSNQEIIEIADMLKRNSGVLHHVTSS